MTDEENSVKYFFTLTDDVSGPASDAASSLDHLGDSADDAKKKVDDAKKKMDDSTIAAIKTMSALQSMQSGLSAVSSSIDTLDIGTEEMQETFKSAAAAVQLFVGVAQTIKGTIEIMSTLNKVLKSTAVLSVMSQVALNPITGLAVVAALGVAGGYAISQVNSKTSNYTTVSSSDTRVVETVDSTGGWY